MNFYLTGIDYRRADILRREEFLMRKENISAFLSNSFQESALLATCNRFEIYTICENPPQIDFFRQGGYSLSGKINVLRHALRLSCGLESQLKGELEIMQQIAAWRRSLPYALGNFWQEAYAKALDIRSRSGLNDPRQNIANVIYADIKSIIGERKAQGIIIGTGKIAELFSLYHPNFLDLTFVSHKHKERAKILALNSGGSVLSIKQLKSFLTKIDFLISATRSPHFIIKQEDLQEVAVQRKRPLYIYDLAIPRDIEPAIKDLPGVVLKNLDDLIVDFEAFNLEIQDKLAIVNYLIEEELNGYTYRLAREQLSLKTG